MYFGSNNQFGDPFYRLIHSMGDNLYDTSEYLTEMYGTDGYSQSKWVKWTISRGEREMKRLSRIERASYQYYGNFAMRMYVDYELHKYGF